MDQGSFVWWWRWDWAGKLYLFFYTFESMQNFLKYYSPNTVE